MFFGLLPRRFWRAPSNRFIAKAATILPPNELPRRRARPGGRVLSIVGVVSVDAKAGMRNLGVETVYVGG